MPAIGGKVDIPSSDLDVLPAMLLARADKVIE